MSKQLIAELEQVSGTLFNLGECFAGLYAAATNFNKKSEIGKNLQLEDLYLSLNNMLVTWGEYMNLIALFKSFFYTLNIN